MKDDYDFKRNMIALMGREAQQLDPAVLFGGGICRPFARRKWPYETTNDLLGSICAFGLFGGAPICAIWLFGLAAICAGRKIDIQSPVRNRRFRTQNQTRNGWEIAIRPTKKRAD